MCGQKGSSFTLVKYSFTDSTVITRPVTILQKRYLFPHVPHLTFPWQNGNGSFSTCWSRNFVLHRFRAAWPQIWDCKTKISLGQRSPCKGLTAGQVLRNFLSLQPVPSFPSSLGRSGTDRDRKTLNFCGNFVCFLSSENKEQQHHPEKWRQLVRQILIGCV